MPEYGALDTVTTYTVNKPNNNIKPNDETDVTTEDEENSKISENEVNSLGEEGNGLENKEQEGIIDFSSTGEEHHEEGEESIKTEETEDKPYKNNIIIGIITAISIIALGIAGVIIKNRASK